ncbi:hypothetical protein LOAG_01493 [Loa loa]|uniref:Uncharacterized protein n=1 Tax=Loa loa TaxID=7209 RepID=A0A1S0UAW4_LOALO|nr:hypothetical protein LOAG_01493 [Loa loa]EFO26997.1 hypothetical protein LOAG_01493 [Loa loa]
MKLSEKIKREWENEENVEEKICGDENFLCSQFDNEEIKGIQVPRYVVEAINGYLVKESLIVWVRKCDASLEDLFHIFMEYFERKLLDFELVTISQLIQKQIKRPNTKMLALGNSIIAVEKEKTTVEHTIITKSARAIVVMENGDSSGRRQVMMWDNLDHNSVFVNE